MAVYVILEEQRRVVVVSVTWLELDEPLGLGEVPGAVVGEGEPAGHDDMMA